MMKSFKQWLQLQERGARTGQSTNYPASYHDIRTKPPQVWTTHSATGALNAQLVGQKDGPPEVGKDGAPRIVSKKNNPYKSFYQTEYAHPATQVAQEVWMDAWDHTGSGLKMQGGTVMRWEGLHGRTNLITVRVNHDGNIDVVKSQEGGDNPVYNEPSSFLARGPLPDVLNQLKDQPQVAQKVQQYVQQVSGWHGPFQGQHGCLKR
jgi:hypothetical protein